MLRRCSNQLQRARAAIRRFPSPPRARRAPSSSQPREKHVACRRCRRFQLAFSRGRQALVTGASPARNEPKVAANAVNHLLGRFHLRQS
jgi:hypothetical protein